MKRLLAFNFVFVFLVGTGCTQNRTINDRVVGGPCDRCDLMYEEMPSLMLSSTLIAPPGEPGEPLMMQGTIYKRDGKTPAPGIVMYVYHTDNSGKYSLSKNQNPNIVHGHLRGWMKTDAEGHYQFKTIRPGAYPSRNAPQHIHAIVKEPGLSLYWIDEYVFDDDPLLTSAKQGMPKKRGGSGIIHLSKNNKGEWSGQRDIVLGLNIPNY